VGTELKIENRITNNKREDRDAEGKYGGQNEALLACNARPTLACKAIHRV